MAAHVTTKCRATQQGKSTTRDTWAPKGANKQPQHMQHAHKVEKEPRGKGGNKSNKGTHSQTRVKTESTTPTEYNSRNTPSGKIQNEAGKISDARDPKSDRKIDAVRGSGLGQARGGG